MRIVKPQQLSLLNRPFEYRGSCFLGISLIAAVRLRGDGRLMSEADLWQEALPVLGDAPVLDTGMPKRGGEFLVSGHAYPSTGSQSASVRAGVQVGDLSKELWVFGDRFLDGGRVSEPERFDRIPLTWENAFGGEGFKANPLGKGARETVNAKGEKRLWLPNIEHPERLFRLKGQRPDPAGFGPVDITWPQRMSLAGTYDDRWLKTEFPGFPSDIRWEYFNFGSSDQWTQQSFTGDETFRLYGMHPDRSMIEGRLPGIAGRCFFQRSGASELEECTCRLTTLWFFPDIEILILVHHGSIKVVEDDASDIAALMIAAEHKANPRDLAHYQQVFEQRADPDGDPLDLVRDEPLMPEGMFESVLQPIIDEYETDRQTALGRNIESAVSHSIADARGRWSEFGDALSDASDVYPREFPEDKLPKQSDLVLPKFDEIEEFAAVQFERLETARREVEEQKKAAISELREGLKEQSGHGPSAEEIGRQIDALENPSGPTGPPGFSAEGQRQQLITQARQVRAMGGDASQLEALAANEEEFATWQEAERQCKGLYRQGAHFQDPAPAAIDSDSLRKRLFEMLAAEECVDGVDFTGIDLSGADLSGRDLRGIFMDSARLDGANFREARLDRAVLAHAHFENTILDGASLKEANLGAAILSKISAKSAVMEETVLQSAKLLQCDFSGARMSGMQLFLEARLEGCIFEGAEVSDLFVNERSIAESNFAKATLIDPIFVKADLSGCNFSGAKMAEAVFVDCRVSQSRFTGANLTGSVFVEQCDLSDCDFSGADLSRANLRGAILHRCRFDEAAMGEADLSETEAGGASFRNVRAAQSRWVRADLREAELAGAVLVGSMLQKADIRSTDLRANLYQSDLGRVHVERSTRFDGAFTEKMNTYPRKFPETTNGRR